MYEWFKYDRNMYVLYSCITCNCILVRVGKQISEAVEHLELFFCNFHSLQSYGSDWTHLWATGRMFDIPVLEDDRTLIMSAVNFVKYKC